MKKPFFLSLVLLLAFFLFPAPETKAMEPVTLALLTPVAIEVAQIALPYVIEGLKNLGVGLIEMGAELANSSRTLLGFFQVMFLWPFGFLEDGVYNLFEGGSSFCKMLLHAICLPVRPFGAIL